MVSFKINILTLCIGADSFWLKAKGNLLWKDNEILNWQNNIKRFRSVTPVSCSRTDVGLLSYYIGAALLFIFDQNQWLQKRLIDQHPSCELKSFINCFLIFPENKAPFACFSIFSFHEFSVKFSNQLKFCRHVRAWICHGVFLLVKPFTKSR